LCVGDTIAPERGLTACVACAPRQSADAAHIRCVFAEAEVNVAAKLVGAGDWQFDAAVNKTAADALAEAAYYALRLEGVYSPRGVRLVAAVAATNDTTAGESTVVRFAFAPTWSVSAAALKEATAPESAFWISFRNMLSPAWFAASPGVFFFCACVTVCAPDRRPLLVTKQKKTNNPPPTKKTGSDAICASDASGDCLGPKLAVAAPVTDCAVDACFALEVSQSLTPQQWRLQASFVENVIRLMGACAVRGLFAGISVVCLRWTRTVAKHARAHTHTQHHTTLPRLSENAHNKIGDERAGALAETFGSANMGGGELMTAGNASAADFRRLRAVPKLTGTAPNIGEGISHCKSLLTAALPLNNTVGHGKIVVLVTAAVSDGPLPDTLSEAESAIQSGVIVMTVGGPDTETLALSNEFRVRADGVNTALADLARASRRRCARRRPSDASSNFCGATMRAAPSTLLPSPRCPETLRECITATARSPWT
jgi:hypothetical protein